MSDVRRIGGRLSLITTEIRAGTPLAGRYRVLRRLGAGGMATVFLAEDQKLGRDVAIKRLHTDAPEASLRRFKQEARLGAALNHPNLVAIYDTVAAEEGALIVMEYVDGKPLSELADGRPLKRSRAIPILRSVADALDHAHAQGVVHRDVKPGNVLVGRDGTVKLADLGIARAIGASQITGEGSVVGTLPYMSPERLAGPGAGGPESDVYALAAVAYELLSGRPPSVAASTGEAAAQEPFDLGRDWPQGPAGAVAVLERALDDEPGARHPSAGEFVDDLDRSLELGGPADAVATPEPGTTRVATRGRTATRPRTAARESGGSRSGRAVAVGLLALGLLAVAGVAIGGGGDDPDSGGSGNQAAATGSGQGGEQRQPEQQEPVAPAPEPEQPAAASEEPTSGAELNDLGFALINEGRYEEAIPVLQRAVDSFEGGTEDVTYAYALYNLGHALRLAGRPDEAIPILEQRLEIPNQRGTVMRELQAAYAAAGGEGPGGEEEGPPFGKAKGHDKHGRRRGLAGGPARGRSAPVEEAPDLLGRPTARVVEGLDVTGVRHHYEP